MPIQIPQGRLGQIERAPIPAREDRLGAPLGVRRRRARKLQRFYYARRFVELSRPEIGHVSSPDETISKPDQLVDHDAGYRIRRRRQNGRRGCYVDRRAGENEPANLSRKARRIDQRQPAALTKTDQIHRRACVVDGDAESGSCVSIMWRRVSIVADFHSARKRREQRLDEAVSGRKIGERGIVKRERRHDKGGMTAFLRNGKVSQSQRGEVDNQAVRRGPFWFVARRRLIDFARATPSRADACPSWPPTAMSICSRGSCGGSAR